MLNQTWPDKVVIEDFYQMTTTDEFVNWMKLTHIPTKYKWLVFHLEGQQAGDETCVLYHLQPNLTQLFTCYD
jgi:hypothetical protein